MSRAMADDRRDNSGADPSEVERLREEIARLRENEAFMALSQRIGSIGSFRWDFDTNYVHWSDEMYRIFDIAPEEFGHTPDSAADMFHPDDRDKVEDAIRSALEGKPKQANYRLLRKDGTVRWVWGQSQLEADAAGNPVRLIGTVHDVTDLRHAEDARHESEQKLRLALSAAQMGTWDWDMPANVVTWSEGMGRVFDVASDDFPYDFDTYWEFIHPEDREHVQAVVQEALDDPEHGDAYEVEHRTITPDGEERWIYGKGRVIRNEHGEPIRMTGIALDVTERKRLEAQLLHSQRMESIGRLAGGVAHDFNNLLTAILSGVQMAERVAPPNPDLAECLEVIRSASDRAAKLTAQLLAFARRQVVELVLVDVNQLITDLAQLLRRLLGVDIELVVALEEGLWGVKADGGQLEQVLVNLAVNARDATEGAGTFTIRTENVTLDRTTAVELGGSALGDYVKISVRDTGFGMDDDVRAHVFEPFFTTKEKGIGLGLASAYGIVRQLGGFMSVTSEPRKGTTFDVYLPRTGEPREAELDADIELPADGTETILVVEDEPLLRRVFVRGLADRGYTVLQASDGEDALHILAGHRGTVHAIVTDVVMPKMGGVQLARRVSEVRPETRVLFISGYSDEAPVKPRHGGAPIDFLHKPFTPLTLVAKVRALLDA